MLKQLLHDGWTLRAVGDLSEVPAGVRDVLIPAQVPGCVHTDLMRAGKIEDPYLDLNEHKLQWIGQTDWEYRLEFEANDELFKNERIDLAADGLDTVARIEMNGQVVAQTENMHRRFRFDVRPMLRRGKNVLTITFASPVKYAWAMREKIGPRPYVNGFGGPFNFIRKMACNFGWDWGPALPTCGIWKGIRLEGWSDLRIVNVRPHWKPDENPYGVGYLSWGEYSPAPYSLLVEVDVERTKPVSERQTITSVLTFNGEFVDLSGEFVEEKPGVMNLAFTIPHPKLWWPKERGEQPLYELKIEAHSWAGSETLKVGEPAVPIAQLDSWSGKIALRTVELDTSPDDIGRKFVVKINGKPIFCKGFNWIPDDCFLDRACDPKRVRERIQQAVDTGANMLRVWGGGIFETDEFYDICDEMGVMVWQDFLFACAMYPEEQPFWSEVEAEARDNVARLAHHPSLVLWNGCNENLWAYRNWGWKDKVQGQTWGKNYYFELIPKIITELDPSRPYWAGSPWSGDYDVDNGVLPNAATHGNKHVWDMQVASDYRKSVPRFASEFGVQGPATYASIASVVPPDERDFGSAAMRHHQKSGDPIRDDADRKNLRRLIEQFNLVGMKELLDALDPPDPTAPVPECGCAPLHAAKTKSIVNFDNLHYLLQLYQARALTIGVEWFRSHQPTCMGTLYWQLNDTWPGSTSWSCIDGDGRKKPLWYATRKFYAPTLLTIEPAHDGLELCAINETGNVTFGRVIVTRQTFTGEVLAREEVEIETASNSCRRVKLNSSILTPIDSSREMIVAHGSPRAIWFFDADKNLAYPGADFSAKLSAPVKGKHLLRVTANQLIRDLCIFVDRLDPAATISDQLVTLLPGETFAFEINSDKELTLDNLARHPVLQCANSYGKTP